MKPSIVDYLIFHRLDEEHRWDQFVAVSYTRTGVMEFRLQVTTTDRATPENAYAVLDGFLMRLTGTTEVTPSS